MPNKNQLFYRNFEIDERAVDEEKRSISFSFSSETPVSRCCIIEILSHKKEHADMSRLRSLLFDHNSARIIGPLKNVRIDEEFKGRAEAVFDDTDEGELAMKRVKSGSLRGVSVGYRVEKFRKLNPDEEFEIGNGKVRGGPEGSPPTYVAVKWAAYEVSLTPIPADNTVGVGRDMRSLDDMGIEVESNQQETHFNHGGKEDMDPKELQSKIDAAIASRDEAHKTALLQVFSRAAALGEKGQAIAFRLLTEGKTPDEITDALFTEVGKERGVPADAGEGDQKVNADQRLAAITDDDLVRGLAEPATIILD